MPITIYAMYGLHKGDAHTTFTQKTLKANYEENRLTVTIGVAICSHRDSGQKQLKKEFVLRPNLKRTCSAGGVMSFKFHATARREAATDACNSDRNMEIHLQNPKHQNPNLNPLPSNLDRRSMSIKSSLPLIRSASYHRTFCCIAPKQINLWTPSKLPDGLSDPIYCQTLNYCLAPRLSDNYV